MSSQTNYPAKQILSWNFLFWLQREFDEFKGMLDWFEAQGVVIDKYVVLEHEADIAQFLEKWGLTEVRLNELKAEYKEVVTPKKLEGGAICIDFFTCVFLEHLYRKNPIVFNSFRNVIDQLGFTDNKESKLWISDHQQLESFCGTFEIEGEGALRKLKADARAYWAAKKEQREGKKVVPLVRRRIFGGEKVEVM